MKKLNKVLIIVLSILVFIMGSVIGVFYVLYPEPTKQWLMTAWNWLNEPLPIVGVSVLMILIFAWKIFSKSSFGKKQINELKSELDDAKTTIKDNRLANDTQIALLEKENDELRIELDKANKINREICETSPNKKIQAIGVKYYGKRKETIDDKTTAN